MTGFLLYTIKCAVYLAVFYAFFLLVMRRTTMFSFNRKAFLAGTIICFIIPVINISLPETQQINSPIIIISEALHTETQTLEGATVTAEKEINILPLILLITYISGAAISLIISVVSFIRMIRLIKNTPEMQIDGTFVKVSQFKIPSFSWGRHIVISAEDLKTNPAILTHEKMHVICGHSRDIMIYTIVTVLQWFNPMVWIARTELKMLHEYEADDMVIRKGIDATQYQLLLVKKAVGAKRFQMANGFNHSKLKNRITMMHKTKTNRWMRLAYLLCVPVLICTMCLCSNPASKKSDELRFDGLSVTALTPEVKSEFSDFTSVEFDEFIETCGTEAQYIVVQIQPCEDEEVIKRFQDYLRENDIFLFNNLIPDQEVYNPQADGNKDALHFQQVEVNPTFQGGDANTFSRWVNQNLVYPYNCKQAGIQGRVTLTFTVNKEGQVCDIKVLRGVCEALDMEAVRVLKSSPAWTPGMAEGEPVNVTYTIPVIFRLTE